MFRQNHLLGSRIVVKNFLGFMRDHLAKTRAVRPWQNPMLCSFPVDLVPSPLLLLMRSAQCSACHKMFQREHVRAESRLELIAR